MTLGNKIAELRKAKGMTQEGLANLLGVSNQAVSKWESDQSCPDIQLLPKIADLFGISIDSLFGREQKSAQMNLDIDWNDDDVLRAVIFIGHKVIKVQDCTDAERIILEYRGDVQNISSECSVQCQEVHGNVSAGTHVDCQFVSGGVNAGTYVVCQCVEGGVNAGGNVECDCVEGGVNAGGNIECDGIEGDVTAGGNVTCDDINGSVEAGGHITCDEINGAVSAGGNVSADVIHGAVCVRNDFQ